METLQFCIELPPITKKNHQRIVRVRGRPMVVPSAQYTRYEREARWWMPLVREPIREPVEVTARFYMPTRRRVDLTNLLEALDDVLVRHGILADDDSKIIVSHDGSRVLYDKDCPRTEVTVKKCGESQEELK